MPVHTLVACGGVLSTGALPLADEEEEELGSAAGCGAGGCTVTLTEAPLNLRVERGLLAVSATVSTVRLNLLLPEWCSMCPTSFPYGSVQLGSFMFG